MKIARTEGKINAGYLNVSMRQCGLNAWGALGYTIKGEDIIVLERAEQILPFKDASYVVDTKQSTMSYNDEPGPVL